MCRSIDYESIGIGSCSIEYSLFFFFCFFLRSEHGSAKASQTSRPFLFFSFPILYNFFFFWGKIEKHLRRWICNTYPAQRGVMVEGEGKKGVIKEREKKKGILIHLRGVRAPAWGLDFLFRPAGHERTQMKSILHLSRPSCLLAPKLRCVRVPRPGGWPRKINKIHF